MAQNDLSQKVKDRIRSKKYQYKMVEISYEQHKLNNFPENKGITTILTENSYSDEIVAYRSELIEELFNIINSENLTEHQRTVLYHVLSGKTQNEIANELGITQSAVHKALRGNLDYKNKRKRYGGVFKKLKKLCKENPKVLEILSGIEELKSKVSAWHTNKFFVLEFWRNKDGIYWSGSFRTIKTTS